MEEAQTSTAGAVADAPLPTISEPASLVGVFVNPRGTFTAMSSKPRFLLAAALVVVVQVVVGFLLLQSGAVKNDTIAKLEAKGVPQEQIDQATSFFGSTAARVIIPTTGAVVRLFFLFLTAGITFFMANLMMGAQLTYRHYFSIATHAAVVALLQIAVFTILATSKGTLDIRLGVGSFLGEDLGYVGRVLDILTSPLLLWSALVSAVGVSAFTGKKLGFGVVAVIPGFLVNVLILATQ